MADFGAWVEKKIDEHGVDIQALSAESGLLYAYLNRLFNSGKKGKPIRPDQKTVRQIGVALVNLGVLEDQGDAEIAADYIPEGYRVIKESELIRGQGTDYDPNEFDDEEDIAFFRGLPPAQREKARRMLKAVFAEEDAIDNAGNIGKRAE